MTACLMDTGTALTAYPRSRAVGQEAREIRQQEINIEREMLKPLAGGRLRAVIATILAEVGEHNSQNSDDALPASMESVRNAFLVLKEALLLAPAPEVTIDPDGEVALTWQKSPRRVFSVSVSPRGALTYAGLFGDSKLHGVEAHGVDGLPREIRAGIQRVFSNR